MTRLVLEGVIPVADDWNAEERFPHPPSPFRRSRALLQEGGLPGIAHWKGYSIL